MYLLSPSTFSLHATFALRRVGPPHLPKPPFNHIIIIFFSYCCKMLLQWIEWIFLSRWTPRRSFYNLQCPGLSPPGNPLEWDLTMLEEGECSTRGARPEAALAGIWVWRCAWGLGESCGHCWPKFWDGVSLSFSLDSFVLSDRRMSDQDMCVEKLLQ